MSLNVFSLDLVLNVFDHNFFVLVKERNLQRFNWFPRILISSINYLCKFLTFLSALRAKQDHEAVTGGIKGLEIFRRFETGVEFKHLKVFLQRLVLRVFGSPDYKVFEILRLL